MTIIMTSTTTTNTASSTTTTSMDIECCDAASAASSMSSASLRSCLEDHDHKDHTLTNDRSFASNSHSHSSILPSTPSNSLRSHAGRQSSNSSGGRRRHHQQQQRQQRSRILVCVLALCGVSLVVQTMHLDGFGEAVVSTASTKTTTINNNNRLLPEGQHEKPAADEAHPLGHLFVPSLDFRIFGKSQYNPDTAFEAHLYCQEFAKDLKWEWWQAEKPQRSLGMGVSSSVSSVGRSTIRGDTTTTNNNKAAAAATAAIGSSSGLQGRLMIGLYAGHDDYARLLERSVWSARVYAQKWGRKVTVVTLQGTAFAPHGCKAPPYHSTLNKIRLLFHAIDHSDGEYDQLLLLDADAFVFDIDTDLTTLLDSKHHVVAGQPMPLNKPQDRQHAEHRRPGIDDIEEWKIHSGATLWNLKHPLTPSIALEWFEGAKAAVVQGDYDGDEVYLQASLQSHLERQRKDDPDTVPLVLNFEHGEFDYSHGKIVKQFVKDDFAPRGRQGNGDNSLVEVEDLNTQRLHKMSDAAKRVCARHAKECASVPVPQYETS